MSNTPHSKKKNLFVLLFSAAMMFCLGYILTTTQSAEKKDPVIASLKVNAEPASAEKNIAKHAEVNVEKQSKETSAVVEHSLANEMPQTWAVGNSASRQPTIVLHEKIVAFDVVEVNSQPEKFPQVGDKLNLPMLKGASLVVNVESISVNPNGDKSWSGHVESYGNDYPVVMTYGEHSVFAMIATPEGSYSMESIDGVGWLYKNPSEFELSHAGAKDFIEVPDVK